MNLSPSRITHRASRQSGFAVIVMMILISIILIYIAGNLRMLHHLNRDLQLVEQKQIQRVNPPYSRTNSLPTR